MALMMEFGWAELGANSIAVAIGEIETSVIRLGDSSETQEQSLLGVIRFGMTRCLTR